MQKEFGLTLDRSQGNVLQPDRHQPSEKFHGSIEGLLSIVLEEADANGYAVYECDGSEGSLVLFCSHGISAHRSTTTTILTASSDSQIVSFSLMGPAGPAGLLDIAFQHKGAITQEILYLLQSASESVGTLLQSARLATELVGLTARIAGLESQLAEVKIAERARGLAHQTDVDRRSEILNAHIASVLNSRQIEQMLTAYIITLEDRLEERRILSEAKEVLQKTLHLSEEDAYFRLREASRRTRSRLVEVAAQVRDGKHELVSRRLRMSA